MQKRATSMQGRATPRSTLGPLNPNAIFSIELQCAQNVESHSEILIVQCIIKFNKDSFFQFESAPPFDIL